MSPVLAVTLCLGSLAAPAYVVMNSSRAEQRLPGQAGLRLVASGISDARADPLVASLQFENDPNQRSLPPTFTIDATASTPIGPPCQRPARRKSVEQLRRGDDASDGTVERVLPRILWLKIILR